VRPGFRVQEVPNRRQAVNREAFRREEHQEVVPNRRQAVSPEACRRRVVNRAVDPNRRQVVNREACRRRVVSRAVDPSRHQVVSRAVNPGAFRRVVHRGVDSNRRRAAFHREVHPEEDPNRHRHRAAHPEAFLREADLAAAPNRLHHQEVRTRRPACTASYRSRRHLDPVCSQRQRNRTLGCLLRKVQRVFGRSHFCSRTTFSIDARSAAERASRP
jgi:hypothetical protein